MSDEFKPGDLVVFRKQKNSSCPGPRAQGVVAASNGDSYTYFVDKYWVVEGLEADGQLCLRTRTGKQHKVSANTPSLRRANWLERLILRARFPKVVEGGSPAPRS